MNQFAQLLSAQKQQAIVLDSCTIIGAKNKDAQVLQFRKKIAKRKDIRIIVPTVVVKEVCKVGSMSFDSAIALIDTFSETGQMDYYYHASHNDSEISDQAVALRTKYPVYLHYPDDHYLVVAKNNDALLVTFDRKLKDVARAEGVMTCSPGNFRIYQ
jgi:predicted nucleic acid-binding protein